jgi:hypothetical protein
MAPIADFGGVNDNGWAGPGRSPPVAAGRRRQAALTPVPTDPVIQRATVHRAMDRKICCSFLTTL